MDLQLSEPQSHRLVQIAYHVADIDLAMERWHAATGLGPFLLRRHIPLVDVHYRGQPTTLDISAAMFQSGELQIELVQQHCDAPSAFRDMFGPDEEGMHHVAVAPTDHSKMVEHYRALGLPVATGFTTAAGGGADYVDARSHVGHMIEIYRVSERIIRLYQQVAELAANWDRQELVVEMAH